MENFHKRPLSTQLARYTEIAFLTTSAIFAGITARDQIENKQFPKREAGIAIGSFLGSVFTRTYYLNRKEKSTKIPEPSLQASQETELQDSQSVLLQAQVSHPSHKSFQHLNF